MRLVMMESSVEEEGRAGEYVPIDQFNLKRIKL